MKKIDLGNEQQNTKLSIEEVARLFEVPPISLQKINYEKEEK
jgi:hypothetical protein